MVEQCSFEETQYLQLIGDFHVRSCASPALLSLKEITAKTTCNLPSPLSIRLSLQQRWITLEGVGGTRPKVTFDVRSNSPFVSQANTRQFGGRI